MHLDVTDELQGICRQIMSEGASATGWESCTGPDYFESEHFSGGFEDDAGPEGGFWFTYRPPVSPNSAAAPKSCFCLTPKDVRDIISGEKTSVELMTAPT